nr:hypothetical protein [Tanacetum cinerariifolium]
TELDPKEALSEAEESHSLDSIVPLMSEEFEASEPLCTRTVSSHSLVSSDSTTPLSPDHPLTHVSSIIKPTRVSFYRMTAHMAVHTQRYRSFYETPSSSLSLTLLVRKRYWGTSELILDTDNDEGHGLGDEDHGLDDESQGLEDERLGLKEEEVVPEVGEDQVPSTFKVVRALGLCQSSKEQRGYLRLDSPPLIHSFTIIACSSITHRFASGYLNSHHIGRCNQFIELGRPVLALEAWAGNVDTQLADMSQARYGTNRLIPDIEMEPTIPKASNIHLRESRLVIGKP